MSIIYQQEDKTFTLQTKHTTYQMLISKYDHLLHLYYGKKTKGNLEYLLTYADRGFAGNPYEAKLDRTYSLDFLPQEFSAYGMGDYRSPAFCVKDKRGISACQLKYKKFRIEEGKYEIQNLPYVHTKQAQNKNADFQMGQVQTLCITLGDELLNVEVDLYYGVLENADTITRSVVVKNLGKEEVYLTKVSSTSLDFLYGNYDLLHFHGRHGMERNLERSPLIFGKQVFESTRGTSSHQQNPFFILADQQTTEDYGSCYGLSFLYSGNFKFEVEKDQYQQTRINFGLQNEDFSYELLANESFYAPEIAMIYSENGLTDLSQRFHKLVQNYICQRPQKEHYGPILINNWEATYFDFDGDKIVEIATKAAELGLEMFVLDDGWFGKRDSDYSGLGDWFVNENKMKGTLKETSDKIHALGMKFGLWIEPEMVSEDSKLYKEHPDYAFAIPNRLPNRSRYQLVLDFSRKEVVNYIFAQISSVLDETQVEYIKMDMNRSISDVYSIGKEKQNQGRTLYEYVLGVYDFLNRLHTRYPKLLIEGCSGGGGRFDAGMLYYTPQIWCSDNTDAIERLRIQYGTSFGYPISTVGAHVSAVPNHQTGRITDINTRSVVAMAGTFGYELDLKLLSEEEKEQIKQQIIAFKEYRKWIMTGTYYRLNNPMEYPEFVAWQINDREKKRCLLSIVMLQTHCNASVNYVCLKGLDETKVYRCEQTTKEYTGAMLMHAGLPLLEVKKEYEAYQIYFEER